MKAILRKAIALERAASMVEAVIILGVFLIVFLLARDYLKAAATDRTNHSMNTALDTIPCDTTGALTGEECL